MLHYLDDFLLVGRPASIQCRVDLQRLLGVFCWLRIPVAMEKLEGPVTCLPFLGIELDSELMCLRLPDSGGPMDPQEGLHHPGAQVLGGEAPARLQGGPSGPDVPTANVRAAQGDRPQAPAFHPTQQGIPVGPNVVAGVSRGLERGLHVDRADA